MMKQLQFYKYATLLLLLLNLAMIAFFFLTAPPPPHVKNIGGKGTAGNILKMDEQQNELFLQFAGQHMQLMDDVNVQQQSLLKLYFNSLIDPGKAINTDSLLSQAQLLERNKIESTYRHFKDIKSMLRPEQQADFEAFMDHALKKILLEQKKPPPPPREN